MTKLTKPQLVARIAELEEVCGLKDTTIAQLSMEADRVQYEERPSRRMDRASTDFPHTVVTVRGQRCVKVKSWEHGRLVTTYKPVQ